MLRQTIIVITLVLLLANSIVGCAGKLSAPTATLTQTSGEVLVMKAGTTVWSNVSAGVNLQSGDRIRTNANSSALITFFEGSTIELNADTEVVVSELIVARETGSTTIKIRQEIGKTRSRVEKLADPASRYEVETPAGVALVRGSIMDVWALANGLTIVDAIVDQCWLYSAGAELLLRQGTRGFMVPGRPPSLSIPPTLPTPGTPPAPPAAPRHITPRTEPALVPPTIATLDASNITVNSARLNGNLTSKGTALSVKVSFQWGTSSGIYPNETTAQTMTAIGAFSFDLGSLASGTTYYFRAKADGGIHGTSYGAERSFTTFSQRG